MKIFRTDPDRFGIRARLLTLLIPGILGLLAIDSWSDYRALRSLVQDAYDRSMLESVNALRGGIGLAPDGTLRLDPPPFVLQTLHDDAGPQHRHLHVGLTPLGVAQDGAARASPFSATAGELTLLGDADLPAPPPPPPPPRPPLRAPLPPPMTAPASASASAAPPMQAASATAPVPVYYDSLYEGQPVRLVALQSRIVDGHGQPFELLIQAAENTGPRDRAQAASAQQALFRDVRMLLVVVVLVWLGVNWSLQPLERLRKSVLANKGHDLKPLDTSGVPHEVAPLVAAVNQHVASYRELLDQQSQFLADASHQLRTPLAIMMTQASVALREKDPEQHRATLRAIITQISRSRRLCEQLLSLAHASDSTPTDSQPEMLDLNTVAKDVVLQYLTLAHEKNQDLGWMAAPPDATPQASQTGQTNQATGSAVPVRAFGAELHEALSNLVHNAIVYTPRGGHITVMVSRGDGTAAAEVRDSGPGIAPARRAEVFERFHHGGTRAENGQTGPLDGTTHTATHGAGLGMAIARAYARRNGGDIELADAASDGNAQEGHVDQVGRLDHLDHLDHAAAPTGLRAILRLPLAAAPAG